MTDNEIVKALECCQNYHECSKCPLNTGSADTNECISECMSEALDLINSQKAENERLLQKLQQAQSEAYREFAERFRQYVTTAQRTPSTILNYSAFGIVNMIDHVHKELTESK